MEIFENCGVILEDPKRIPCIYGKDKQLPGHDKLDFPLRPEESGLRQVGINCAGNDNLNIGLFGFGCVGQGLYDVLNYSLGLKADIGRICVKDRTKERKLGLEHFTFERKDVLENKIHNLIVELIDDSQAAFEIICSAMKSGKDVVSANKKTIAENFEYLYKLQQQTGASLLYEGACGGSIPILRTLEEYYDNELLKSIRGIVNGSSNYILTQMEVEGLSFHEAVRGAQELGFAETDPWLDVAGYDSKYKLCLLAAHGFGLILKPGDIFNLGIQNISKFDINYAKEKKLKIKLVAHVEKVESSESSLSSESFEREKNVAKVRNEGQFWDKYRVYVLPHFISQNDQLAAVNYEFNGIEVEGLYSDKQFFSGKGAGSHSTGSAVLSDISALTYDYKYGYRKLKKRVNGHVPDYSKDSQYLNNDFLIKVYIRYDNKDDLCKIVIDSIDEKYSSKNNNYLIANVRFSSLRMIQNSSNIFVCAV